ncbi:MAG: hypothetical protein ACLTXM_12945 [Enterococcus sp.]
MARRIARLLIITGYLTNWKDPVIAFGRRQSEIQLFYYLLSYSVKDLNALLDDLIALLDDSTIKVNGES